MKKSSEVSIIIPAYNSEKYIEECLDSIFAQTYSDYEVIVINDGSTDNTESILKKYEKEHSNLTFKTIENHGQGYARNLGLALATGQFIQFIDADDIVSPIMLENTVRRIKRDNSDFVFFDWSRFDDVNMVELPVRKKPFFDTTSLEGLECRRLYGLRPYYTVEALYNKSFLINKEIKYGEGYLYEDVIFWLKVVNNARKVSIIKDNFYRVRVHGESSTQSKWDSDRHTESFIQLINDSNKYVEGYPGNNFNGYYEYIVDRFFVYHRDRVAKERKETFEKDFLKVINKSLVSESFAMNNDLKKVLELSSKNDVNGLKEHAKQVQIDKDERRIARETASEKKGIEKIKWRLVEKARYEFVNNRKDENKIYIEANEALGLLDIALESLRLDIRKMLFVVPEDSLCINYLRNNHYKVKTVHKKTRNYYKELYSCKYVIADKNLFKQYVKTDNQIFVTLWQNADINITELLEKRPNDFERQQKNLYLSDYLCCDSQLTAEKIIKDYAVKNLFEGSIITRDTTKSYAKTSERVLIRQDSFNEVIRITKEVLELDDCNNKVFLIDRSLASKNTCLIELLSERASFIPCDKSYITDADERKKQERYKFGTLKYQETLC